VKLDLCSKENRNRTKVSAWKVQNRINSTIDKDYRMTDVVNYPSQNVVGMLKVTRSDVGGACNMRGNNS
jgi:hypothetical protein